MSATFPAPSTSIPETWALVENARTLAQGVLSKRLSSRCSGLSSERSWHYNLPPKSHLVPFGFGRSALGAILDILLLQRERSDTQVKTFRLTFVKSRFNFQGKYLCPYSIIHI